MTYTVRDICPNCGDLWDDHTEYSECTCCKRMARKITELNGDDH